MLAARGEIQKGLAPTGNLNCLEAAACSRIYLSHTSWAEDVYLVCCFRPPLIYCLNKGILLQSAGKTDIKNA